ncbi:MAG: heme lyase CcmF/NrfE family subunit, partial [Gemmatimonadetes bacterium]|nr:heme lyase CcmF/NrfE family subunit [Gemmatimonadota bacterium]
MGTGGRRHRDPPVRGRRPGTPGDPLHGNVRGRPAGHLQRHRRGGARGYLRDGRRIHRPHGPHQVRQPLRGGGGGVGGVTILGEIALWIALPVALWGAVVSFVGGRTGRSDLVLSGERTVHVVTLLLIVTSLGIIAAFVGNRYEYLYVANYSNRELDTYFKVAGLWAGQRGSLVFWTLLLSVFASIAVFRNRRRNREFMPYVGGTLLGLLSFLVIVLLFADVNPFERMGFTPANGRGLNPQLQNYWMTIHPPTLYLGFTSFAVPFAFAVSALLTGRLDSRWIAVTRRWILLSWFFLTIGIIFGMRWAYEELGWGGYWFWDPVENASLLPWLTATAFLHSIQIQENRGMLKVWNMGLVVTTFLLTLFATFLTRSGLIESVHSFAQNLTIAYIFLGFMGGLAAFSILLIVHRLPSLRPENRIQSFLSRESAFLFNNLLLLGIAFAVAWGTLFPLITEGLFGQKINVGPPFYNRVNIPIGLILLTLMGIGPVIAWRRASPRNLRRNFTLPLAASALMLAALLLTGVRHTMALATFAIAAFVMTIVVTEFWKGTKARARIAGEGAMRAFASLVKRNRRRWGGYVVHAGVVVVFTGLAGAAFDTAVVQELAPGEAVTVRSAFGNEYRLVYESLSHSRPRVAEDARENDWRWTALMTVYRNGERTGIVRPERRFYPVMDQASTEVGIVSAALEDLYVIPRDVDLDSGADRVIFEVKTLPLVPWIWSGGLLVAIGALVGLWPPPPMRAHAAQHRAVPG